MKPASPSALIISRNARTTKGLCSYFGERGVGATVTDKLHPVAECDQFTAILVFPDEFPESRVRGGIRTLVVRFATAWIVVVTRDTVRFEQLLAEVGVGAQGRLLVLPRPAWGWALLDRVLRQPPPRAES